MKHDDNAKDWLTDWEKDRVAEINRSKSTEQEEPYDHDAECEEALHAELRRLRVDSNRFLRQRNELLQAMRLILAATQNWNGGWVHPTKANAEKTISDIAQCAGIAIADVGRNGQ
jgi:hypothetical protein